MTWFVVNFRNLITVNQTDSLICWFSYYICHVMLSYAECRWHFVQVKSRTMCYRDISLLCRWVVVVPGHAQFLLMTCKIAVYCQSTSRWLSTLRNVLQRRKKPSWWCKDYQMIRLVLNIVGMRIIYSLKFIASIIETISYFNKLTS